MKISPKTITLGIILVLLLGGAYWYFFLSTPAAPISATTPVSSEQQRFLDLAGQLSPISFDTRIFSDPRFTGLSDLTTMVIPEPVGRPDPFSKL